MSFLGGDSTGTKPQKLSTISVQTSSYGICLGMAWGTTRITGNLTWYGDFVAIEHTESQGGKGGGPTTTNYTYKTAFTMGLLSGKVIDIPRVWSGKDKTTLAALGLDLKDGAPSQSPWSYLSTKHPDQALNYPGVAYIGAASFDLGNSASLPNLALEVKTDTAGIAGTADAAPWTIVSDLLAAGGFPMSRLGGLADYANFCGSNGLFLSPALTEQKRAAEHVQDVLEMTHTAAVPSEGLLKLIPYGDTAASANGYTYTPNVTPVYELTEDDFLPVDGDLPIRIMRKAPSDAKNRLRIEFKNRDMEYATGVANAFDEAHIAQYGERPATTVTYEAIKSPVVASKVAFLKMQRGLYVLNTYEFRLSWRYCLLEPMDIVTLTHPMLELFRVPVRITEVEEDAEGQLTFTAEDFPQGAGLAPLVTPPAPSGYSIDMNVAPGSAAAPVVFEPPVGLAGRPELWLATSGGESYGGSDVWVSLDNATYQRVGTISGKARHGITTATLPSVSDPDTTSTLSVDLSISGGQLLGGTADDRDLYNTLCWVGGEFISYRDAALTGVNRYGLSSLRRGAYGSSITSHSAASKFVRCDDRLFRYAYDPALVGKTVYIKLQAYNIYGGAYQDLATLTPTAYVVQGAPLGTVGGLALEQPFVGTSCQIKWTPYSGASSYTVEVWTGSTKRRTVTGLTAPRYAYSYEDGKADGGPYRSLEFRVYAVSANGLSGSAAVLAASNPQLGVPTGIATAGAGGSIVISANKPTATDYAATKVWISGTSGFDPAVTAAAYDGPATYYAALNLAAGTWYLRIAQYDVFGSDGLVTSGELSVSIAGATGVRTVTSLPANPAAVGGDMAVFLDVADANLRGLWGWDGSAWKNTRDGANLVANSVTAAQMSVTNLAAISANMGALTSGSFTLDASGFIRGGATSFSAGAGIWMGYQGGAYKFRVGVPGASRMEWTGSSFDVYDASGNLTITSGVVDFSKLSNKPTSLSAINSAEGTKLSGVATGATANIVGSGTLASRPTGANGDFYCATDTSILYQKVAGSWVVAANNYNNTSQLTDGANLGQTATWSGVTGTGKPADNATVGAPSGTYVGGTLAQTVESNAATALSTANSATASLAAKLNKAGDTITGRINMTVADGLFAGTDLNNGVYLGSGGLTAKKSGATTFAIDTAGNASFAGALDAATGTFSGSLSAAGGTFAGTLTSGAVNAVNTINIAGNAVTVPLQATWSGLYSGGVAQLAYTGWSDFAGQPVVIIAQVVTKSHDYGASAEVYIFRDGSQIAHGGAPLTPGGFYDSDNYQTATFVLIDYPGGGAHYYGVGGFGGDARVSAKICVLGAKR